LRFWPAEAVATGGAKASEAVAVTVGAKASEAVAVEGVTALEVAAAVAVRRLPVAEVVLSDTTEAAIAATSAVEVVAAAVGVVRLAAAAIVVVLDGKATSAFPDKSIQKLFAPLRADGSARPRTLAR
jgi:hypothetical protein